VWDTAAAPTYAQAAASPTGQYGTSEPFIYNPCSATPAPDCDKMLNFRGFTLTTNPPDRVLVIRENGDRVELLYSGTHTIEGADNLPGPWNVLYTGTAPFTDANSATLPARFYRMHDGGVYSVNAVGFYRIVPCAGFSMIANQLLAPGGNAVPNVIKTPQNGTFLYKLNRATGGYVSTEYLDGLGWVDGDMSLNPGEGGFLYNPFAWTNRFIGEIALGSSIPIPPGFSILSSPIPQSASFTDDPPNGLGFPVRGGDQVYQFRGCGQSGYIANEYIEGVGWSGEAPPVIGIGESFFFFRTAAGSRVWTRTFNVGP
jgi:hypothetical protein